MTILAIECSTSACSCALEVDGEVFHWSTVARQKHAELLLENIETLVLRAGISFDSLDHVAFANGPGSFTGLRIAAGVAQGLAYGLNKSVIGVSTLATLAQGAYRAFGATRALPCLDARMNEVYLGHYHLEALGEARGEQTDATLGGASGVMRSVGKDLLTPPEQAALRCSGAPDPGGCIGVGSGWEAYGAALESQFPGVEVKPDMLPDAMDVLKIAATRSDLAVPAHLAQPVYLRNTVTRQS